jgi:apolipoprotein N-acyltransferase
VAYAVQNYPRLIQIADFTGVYGLSFLLSFSSAFMAEWFEQQGSARRALWRPGLIGLCIFVWFSVYGMFKLAHPTPTVDRVPLLLIQHNADTWVGGELDSLSTVMKLSRQGFDSVVSTGIPAGGLQKSKATPGETEPRFYKPALIVWSETVLRRPFEDYRPFYRKNPPDQPLIPFLEETGVPLLTGAPVVLNWETYDATNSAILIEPTSRVAFSYAKQHPVPFAEAIPFWEYQWMRDFMKNVVGLDGGWTMGTTATVMEIPTPSKRPLRFGVPICFEDAFAGLCADFYRKGADLMINITNDSWSKTDSAEIQHFAAARFRTVENRRVLVRSTNAGLTAVVDAEGRTIASLPLFVPAYLAVSVPVQRSDVPTVYFLLGDWFPALGAIVILLYLVGTTIVAYRSPRDLHLTGL